MGKNVVDSLAGWKKAYLGVALILTPLWIAGYFLSQSLPRGQKIGLVTLVLTLALSWSPLIFQQLGLRATSSIYAAIVSMMYIGSVLYSLTFPGYFKLLGFIYVLLAVFYYFGSTKTWKAHELFWLAESRQKKRERKELAFHGFLFSQRHRSEPRPPTSI